MPCWAPSDAAASVECGMAVVCTASLVRVRASGSNASLAPVSFVCACLYYLSAIVASRLVGFVSNSCGLQRQLNRCYNARRPQIINHASLAAALIRCASNTAAMNAR